MSTQPPSQLQSRTLRQLVCALLLLALLPRAAAAWQLPDVSNDAHYYIFAAEALGNGEISLGLGYLNLNVYPVILLGLHGLGLGWITAGKLWGVVVGTLIVLPLFGWTRRLSDDRVALAACFLYAIDPSLIELAPEPVRETTFWFLMNLCLYLSLRAAVEVRWHWFALSGTAFALAAHTRGEGWLLLVPVVGWAAMQFRTRPQARFRLAGGTLLALAMTPALLVLANVTLLAEHPRWEFGRLDQFQLALEWFESATAIGPAPSPQAEAAAAAPAPALASATDEISLLSYLTEFAEGLWPLHLVALLVGIGIGWRQLLGWKELPLTVMGLATLGAIWIRLVELGSMQTRYFLTLSFLLAPFAGMGLLRAAQWLWWIADHTPGPKFSRRTVTATWAVILVSAAWIDSLNDGHHGRSEDAAFGMWLGAQCGRTERVLVDYPKTLRVAYYTRCRKPGDLILNLERQLETPTDLLIISRVNTPADLQRMVDVARARGLMEFGDERLHPGFRDFVVMTPRHTPSEQTAGGVAPVNR